MYGIGIFKGLSVTIKHFVATFVDDLQWVGRRNTQATFTIKQGLGGKGMYTVQYPEEKIAVPERFRFVPFLVTYNPDDPEYPNKDWCTSCGICAKVCPPQCIWIVRGTNPETGRPKPEPEQFYIDIDICMNCGYCAEYCPFDAIKMDHDYELASYDRTGAHVRDHDHLVRPLSYWQHIAPTTAAQEQVERKGYDHSDVQKARVKQGLPASRSGPTSDKPEAPKPVAAPVAAAPVAPVVTPVAPAPVAAATGAAAAPAPAAGTEGKPVVRRRNASAPAGTAAPAAAAPAVTPVSEPPVATSAPVAAAPAPAEPPPQAPAAPTAAAPDPNKPAAVVRRRNAPPPKKD
jgi:NADH-quinone oxidoreductase subunit I